MDLHATSDMLIANLYVSGTWPDRHNIARTTARTSAAFKCNEECRQIKLLPVCVRDEAS